MPSIKGQKITTKKQDASTKKGRGGKATSKGKGTSAVKRLLGGIRMAGGGGSSTAGQPKVSGPRKGVREPSRLQ